MKWKLSKYSHNVKGHYVRPSICSPMMHSKRMGHVLGYANCKVTDVISKASFHIDFGGMIDMKSDKVVAARMSADRWVTMWMHQTCFVHDVVERAMQKSLLYCSGSKFVMWPGTIVILSRSDSKKILNQIEKDKLADWPCKEDGVSDDEIVEELNKDWKWT